VNQLLQAGVLAPDFDIPVLIGGVRKQFRLSEHQVLLAAVLGQSKLHWEPVSTQQMIAYQVEREKFLARDAQVVAISVDSIMNTSSWEREIGPFDFLLCSDFWPHGEVSRQYGVLREEEPFKGASNRAIFIVGRDGSIEFSKFYALDQVPNLEETLAALPRS